MFVVLSLFCVTDCSLSQAKSYQDSAPKGWRGLLPLRSTRRDVETLLGSPQTTGGSSYETEDASIFVEYSDGPCEKGWPYGWNVNKDTVVRITVSPKNTVRLADLNLDEKKYVMSRDSHINTKVHYVNHNDGIAIEFDEIAGRVRSFSYQPATSDLKLRCADASNTLPVGRSQADSFFKFDAYGDLPVQLEHERLDSVAAELIRLPATEAYVIAYAGRVALTGEAAARAMCARDYLMKKHHINADRVKAIDGGYREAREFEVYIEPKGGPLPLPRPSVRPSQVTLSQQKHAVKCSN